MKKTIKGLPFISIGVIFLTLTGCFSSKSAISSNTQQVNIEREKNDRRPLYIVNGHILPFTELLDNFLQVKPKYFKDVQIIDVEKSASTYGEAGEYGVVEITLTDSAAAYNDLMEPNTSTKIKSMNPFQHVKNEREPKLIGGMAKLQRNLEYPKKCRETGVDGNIIITLIVTKKGEVEDVKVMNGIGWGCDREAVRVAKMAKFLPGLQYAKPVKVVYALPFRFRLN